MNNLNKLAGVDRHVRLDSRGFLRDYPRYLDLEILFELFEEQLGLPSFTVEICRFYGRLDGIFIARFSRYDLCLLFFRVQGDAAARRWEGRRRAVSCTPFRPAVWLPTYPFEAL